MERYTDVKIFYIVFDKAHTRYWFRGLVHPKFQHVHLLTATGDGRTLMVNPMSHCLAVREYDNSIVDIVHQEINQHCTAVLQFTVYYGALYRPAIFEPISCVSVCKRVLGIRRRLLTPYQLYKELLKAGALAIKPY
jgi:hypothetical protein